MADLPEPLTPADCDLRDFPFMPLDVARLRDSDLASLADPEARWANVMSWAAGWHQVPAASLPDDDAALCRLLGYGRDLKTWAKVRAAGGLHGWMKCADGRLYHPVVAEKAMEAWERKQIQRKRSKAGNDARWGRKAGAGDEPASSEGGVKDAHPGPEHDPKPIPEASTDHPNGMPERSHKDARSIPQGSQGTGTETGIGKREGSEAIASAATDASPPAEAPPPDARTALWREGLPRLQRLTGKPPQAARTLMGRYLRDAGDDCALLSSVLFEAEQLRPADPSPWIAAAIQRRTSGLPRRQPAPTQNRRAWAADPNWGRPMANTIEV